MASDTIEQIKARMAECEITTENLENIFATLSDKKVMKIVANALTELHFLSCNDRNLLLIKEGK